MAMQRKRRGLLDDPQQDNVNPLAQYSGFVPYLGAMSDALMGRPVGQQLAQIQGSAQDRAFRQHQAALREQQRKAAAGRAAANQAAAQKRWEAEHALRRDQFGLQQQRFAQESRLRDPAQAYKLRAEQAQLYGLDPRSPEGRAYVLSGRLDLGTKTSIFDQRHKAAVGLGLQPGSEQHKQFVLTGKMQKPEESTAGKISGGLNRLATVPTDVGTQSFEYATGPLQGTEDSAWFNPGPPLARAWGSIANAAFGNSTATTSVRNRIAGDVEALAAVIKPLIRKPGEGPWTDSDQRRLVSVVGSLAESNNVEDYRRNLENVRQRIMSNFGIQLPPIAFPGDGQGPTQPIPPGVTVRQTR